MLSRRISPAAAVASRIRPARLPRGSMESFEKGEQSTSPCLDCRERGIPSPARSTQAPKTTGETRPMPTPEEIGRYHGKLAALRANGHITDQEARGPFNRDTYGRLFPEPDRRCVTPPAKDWR